MYSFVCVSNILKWKLRWNEGRDKYTLCTIWVDSIRKWELSWWFAWIEAKDINIKSAEIYDNGNKIADAKNVNGRFEAVISVPVNKSDNHNVKVIADTKEKGKIESEEITLKVLDKFPVSYYDSEKNIDDEIASLFTDDYNNMSDDKKINYINEKLHKMSENSAENGESYVVDNSIDYDAETNKIFFVEAAGTYCYIDFNDYESGTNAGESSLKAEGSEYLFESKLKNKINGELLIVSGLSDDASNSLSYYQELSDAIDDETGFNSTLELATLNNLRYDFLGKDFLVIECHGSLYKNNGVTVPMLQS